MLEIIMLMSIIQSIVIVWLCYELKMKSNEITRLNKTDDTKNKIKEYTDKSLDIEHKLELGVQKEEMLLLEKTIILNNHNIDVCYLVIIEILNSVSTFKDDDNIKLSLTQFINHAEAEYFGQDSNKEYNANMLSTIREIINKLN